MNQAKRIKNQVKQIGSYLNRLGLFLFYMALRRRLQLHWISPLAPIIFKGNGLELRWQVKGCYKIEINNTITLTGITNFVQLNPRQTGSQLRINFYGYGQRIERNYQLRIVNSPLKQNGWLSLILKENEIMQRTKWPLVLRMKYLCCTKDLPSIYTPLLHVKSALFVSKTANLPRLKIRLEAFNPQ